MINFEILSKNASVCDLSCSSANFLILLANLRKDFKLFGVDNSASMLQVVKSKAQDYGLDISFFEVHLSEFDSFTCDVFVANYT
ncbi:class I SAM-dependent methyltransferase, partial [Campylobacter jejuni]|nr:class I SAM-dependent methyltransferase [Campylobacter jejuni]